MSHRTAHLPADTSRLRRLFEEVRYHEASRQVLALIFVAVVGWWGNPSPPWFYPGLPLILLGISIRTWASGYIMKNKELATDGPYALVRHPLYTGNLLIMIGFALSAAVWWGYVLLVLIVAVFYPAAIRYEDGKLHRIFGERWEQWRAVTPALAPRRLKFGSAQPWSFRQSLLKNGEPLIVAYLLIWVWVLYEKLG